jgi:hypothetical protein
MCNDFGNHVPSAITSRRLPRLASRRGAPHPHRICRGHRGIRERVARGRLPVVTVLLPRGLPIRERDESVWHIPAV